VKKDYEFRIRFGTTGAARADFRNAAERKLYFALRALWFEGGDKTSLYWILLALLLLAAVLVVVTIPEDDVFRIQS